MKKHILTVFPGFGIGGAQVRYALFANRFADKYVHTIVTLNGNTDCAEKLAHGLGVELVDFSAHRGLKSVPKIRQFVRSVNPDLLMTSNWGAIEWSLSGHKRHIHTEDGFGPEEQKVQLRRRVVARELLLRRAMVVVPSTTLYAIARHQWRLSKDRLRYIPNGVDTDRFHPAFPDIDTQTADTQTAEPRPFTVGTVATLRREKNIARLIRVFSALTMHIDARLVIVGGGSERQSLEALAGTLGVSGRVTFAGQHEDTSGFYHGFDVFAMSSDTEQMPLSVLEAMASGLSVVSTDVGDVRAMVEQPNAAFIDRQFNEDAMATMLLTLAKDPNLRRRIGTANRARAKAVYSLEGMFGRYEHMVDRVIAGAESELSQTAEVYLPAPSAG